ncbi:lytic transglycosylase [Leisingera sp. ANG-M1]|uniref:lytic transglycosylase domain-containing protein n=1 Tax=Leisingera sp. ANG-M1 TaxID=1577895 RepID=UPI00057EC23F|nr:lytic transglycosylase domain-containing protein [Leisingera sp. ANG-M1]KIC08827.1 lytic transglycosylase [Leisingera sp. ANG-M1]
MLMLAAGLFPGVPTAQGVPVFDRTVVDRQIAKVSALVEDLRVQNESLLVRQSLADVQANQLSVLEEMTAAMTGPGFNVSALETSSTIGADTVYPVASTGQMDKRLFGDARETVERMIAQVALEYSDAAAAAGLSPTQFRCLFQALIKQESRFNVAVTSPVGAYGLTQLMPGTASDMGVDRTIPIENLRGGAKYITIQLRRFGNIPNALAAYNAGPGRVIEYGGVPPFSETQGYVRNVTRFYNEYLAVVGGADALGTLSPSDMALAEYSNTSDAAAYYGAASHATAEQVTARLASIIRQIDAQPNAKAALELNTYARAEIARILTMRARLMAASQIRSAAYEQHLTADRFAEMEFKHMRISQ